MFVGLHSDELISGELVIPKKVTKSGEFLSHNLTHHHGEHYRHHRRRRSFNDENPSSAESATEPEVHYRLEIQNEQLHLELE